MTRTVDVDEVSDALARAADAALHGTRGIKAGQVDQLVQVQEVARRILTRATASAQAWANWEAINVRLGPDSPWSAAVTHLELPMLNAIRKALARDAILGSFGLSDPWSAKADKRDRLTLCYIAALLSQDDVRTRLESREWALGLGHRSNVADWAAGENKRRIDFFRQRVVPEWSSTKPTVEDLSGAREMLRPVRHGLAHALDVKEHELATVNQIRQLVDVTLNLAIEASLFLCGSATSYQSLKDNAQQSADKFWDYASRGAIEAHRDWQVQMRADVAE